MADCWQGARAARCIHTNHVWRSLFKLRSILPYWGSFLPVRIMSPELVWHLLFAGIPLCTSRSWCDFNQMEPGGSKKKKKAQKMPSLQIFVHPAPICCFIGNESHGFWVTLKCTQAFIILGRSCNCYLYIIYHQVYLTIECIFYWCRSRWICLINRVNNKEKNVSINKKWFLYYITSGQ